MSQARSEELKYKLRLEPLIEGAQLSIPNHEDNTIQCDGRAYLLKFTGRLSNKEYPGIQNIIQELARSHPKHSIDYQITKDGDVSIKLRRVTK